MSIRAFAVLIVVPYNPSARAVGLFFCLGMVVGASNFFGWSHSPLTVCAAIAFIGVSGLLFMRRSFWKRFLTITEDALIVPSGFLRLRPARLVFASIRRVWVTEIFGTTILRVRTAERDVEI